MQPLVLLKPLGSVLPFLGHRSGMGAKCPCPRECVPDAATGRRRRRKASNGRLSGPISRARKASTPVVESGRISGLRMVWAPVLKPGSWAVTDKGLLRG